MGYVFRVGADSAQDAEDRLNEERGLHQPTVNEMGERIEMTNVVALDLEPRAVIGAGSQNFLDIAEGILKDSFV